MRENIGRYRVVREIGHGAMGRVWLAYDETIDRRVAVKELILPAGQPPEQHRDAVERFKREARAAGRLSHPHIVTIFAVEEEDGLPFIIMEYLEGENLGQAMHRGPIPMDRAVRIAIEVSDALAYAHSMQVVHRDVKPDNIFLTREGRVKVADFGIARIGESSSMTGTGTLMGTLGYMSPEQVRGEKVDSRSDIFSLGVVLYEMLAGVNPFSADSFATTLFRIVNQDLPPMHDYNPAIPPQLQAVVDLATAKELERRYPVAERMRDDLQRYAGGEPVTAVLPPHAAPPTRTPAGQAYPAQGGFAPAVPAPGAGPTPTGMTMAAPAGLQEQQVLASSTAAPAAAARGRGKAWLIAVLSLLVVAVIGALAFLLVKGSSKNDSQASGGTGGTGSAGGSKGGSFSADPGFTIYEDRSGRFRMEYPQDWREEVRRQQAAAEFYAPLEPGGDAFSDNVSVSVDSSASQSQGLDGYVNTLQSQIKQSVPDAVIAEVRDVTMGGEPGKWVIYSGKGADGLPYKWMKAITLSGDAFYVLTYEAAPSSYPTYLEQAEKMVETFQAKG